MTDESTVDQMTVSLIRDQIKVAHEWFEGAMTGVTQAHAAWQPAGTTHPIGSLYAHATVTEDVMINALIQGGAPLFATSRSSKTGISDLQVEAKLEWARSVQVGLGQACQFTHAVYANTDAYLDNLGDDQLGRIVDLSQQEMSQWPLGAFLITFVLGHIHDMMGEISVLTGLQGLQGYRSWHTSKLMSPPTQRYTND
jgi:hypothetical protein